MKPKSDVNRLSRSGKSAMSDRPRTRDGDVESFDSADKMGYLRSKSQRGRNSSRGAVYLPFLQSLAGEAVWMRSQV